MLPQTPDGDAMTRHRHSPAMIHAEWRTRMFNALLVAGSALGVMLGAGVLGYHYLAGLPWIDALLNASMILGGMGPIDPVRGVAGKLFASVYALVSGLAFVGVCGVLIAPFAHRFLRRFHAEFGQD
jgi:hypothetical protein